MNLSTRLLSRTLALLALSGASFSFAQSSGDPNSMVDGFERELETGRHERLLDQISTTDSSIDPFSTDGCSGGLSLAWAQMSDQFPEFADRHGNRPPWEECCVAHDRLYHIGGSDTVSALESFELRRDADLQLQSCVARTGVERSGALKDGYDLGDQQIAVLYQTIAGLMYRAVRLGGMPCTKHAWRWGYGWPECE